MPTIHALGPAESRVVPDLTPRFVRMPRLRAAHRRSLASRHPEGILELREGAAVRIRLSAVRVGASVLTALPLWERIADGGLGRSHDPAGELVWVFGVEAAEDADDAEVARGIATLLASYRAPFGVGVVVDRDAVDLVQSALGPCARRELPGYFEGETGRTDGVLLHLPGTNVGPSSVRTPRGSVRVAAVQPAFRGGDVPATLARYDALLARAAAAGAKLAVLPEYLTHPFLTLDAHAGSLRSAVRGLDAHRGAFLEAMSRAAKSYRLALVAGTHLALDGDALVNVAAVFDDEGRLLGTQRKLHPTPYEAECYGVLPGESLGVFDVAGLRLAVAICYDVEFPEVGRRARALGADLLAVPYNTDTLAGHHRIRRTASARAVEDELFVVTAGAVGRYEHRFDVEDHHARSAAFCPSDRGFPDDGVLGECALDAEDVLVVELARDRLGEGADVRPYRDRDR